MSRFSHLTRDAKHRPWPLPVRPWVMTMSWCDLLFAHWEVEAELLRSKLPPGLELETFEGRAYVGVVPFRMEAVGPRGLGGLPPRWGVARAFPELNVRTYVVAEGKPGVIFLSLDATSPLAIWGARTFFHLPYLRARIAVDHDRGWIHHHCERRDRRMGEGDFVARFRGVGERLTVTPGSFDHWLTERYCLYATNLQGETSQRDLWRGEIHHPTWPLRRAEVEIERNTIARAHGLELVGPPIAHAVERIDVVAWWPEAVGSG